MIDKPYFKHIPPELQHLSKMEKIKWLLEKYPEIHPNYKEYKEETKEPDYSESDEDRVMRRIREGNGDLEGL